MPLINADAEVSCGARGPYLVWVFIFIHTLCIAYGQTHPDDVIGYQKADICGEYQQQE